jgi:predicted nuclease with TOPRIM domain
LQKSQEDYNALKERAKNVASELKERRAECRTLTSELQILKSNNADLQDRIAQLEVAGMDMNESSKEIQDELSSLRSQLQQVNKEREDAQSAIGDERRKGEEALSIYKKKAQQSLALANSRTASAIQAKEEAELEARAARVTADSAMQRALVAETNGKQALADAKQYVEEMEKEVVKYNDVKKSLQETQKELEGSRTEAKKYQESSEKVKCDLTIALGRLETEQATSEDLKQSLSEAQTRSNELYEEVERLRRENQRSQDEIRKLSDGNRNTTSSSEPKVIIRHEPNAEAEATIAMLKQELRDANNAIKDLKETLKATMEERDTTHPEPHREMNGHNGHSDAGMPLFYAMEKQAELTQARDEIARLANLLGDAESSKQEALEAVSEMRVLMEDAQSRLQRQEQLKKSPEEELVNLEYLKNIVLSFLNATTTEEKKTLLPVIGTVLCLTAEERRKASEAVDKGSSSMIDSVASSVINFNWR